MCKVTRSVIFYLVKIILAISVILRLHLTKTVYRMAAQIELKIPPGKTHPRFYLSECRHEILAGKNDHPVICWPKPKCWYILPIFPFLDHFIFELGNSHSNLNLHWEPAYVTYRYL